ncbi:DUF5025 domain-containing protein [Fibrisoma montanum]|nr:DUF5025 domain-containing protein [Fibrisoma montanum]
MRNRFISLGKQFLSSGLLLILLSCREESMSEEPGPQPLNFFEANVNGQIWQPSKLDEENCMQAFQGAWSAITVNGEQKPYYTVWAYRDSRKITNYQSENAFRFQFTNVLKTGQYGITGSYKNVHDSYALFTVNKPDGSYTRYVNTRNKGTFTVELSEFLPKPGSEIKGIKGSFYGTLYNETDPTDSLVFQRGNFTLQKINWYNFNQCAQ